MPRISVEESWWVDPRRELLKAKIGLVADAVMLQVWRLAQEYWKKDHTVVPKKIFYSIPHAKEVIESMLADEREDGVYVNGSGEHLEWLYERVEAGRKGGFSKNGGDAVPTEIRKERIKANNILNLSIKSGETIRPNNCENCGFFGNIHGHHENYDKPLAVVWLCASCHGKVHSKQLQASLSKSKQAQASSLLFSTKKKKNNTCAPDGAGHVLLELWNLNRGKLAAVRGTNESRSRRCAARWNELPSKEYWVEVITRAAESPFCNGAGKDGWHADFDWLLQPETHLKLAEGKYDRKKRNNLAVEQAPDSDVPIERLDFKPTTRGDDRKKISENDEVPGGIPST